MYLCSAGQPVVKRTSKLFSCAPDRKKIIINTTEF